MAVRPLPIESLFIQTVPNISHIFLVFRAYTVSALTTIQHLDGHFQSLEVNPSTTFLDQ